MESRVAFTFCSKWNRANERPLARLQQPFHGVEGLQPRDANQPVGDYSQNRIRIERETIPIEDTHVWIPYQRHPSRCYVLHLHN